ncbi:hypothetical protein [Luteolibacter sp. Populi]|uniref:hypothetical protein n=1 Tax=Luteolibacter sp. Populi TaxID=3230487 RepID=UPI0034666A0C
MKPITLSHRSIALALTAAACVTISYAADGPEPTVDGPVAGEDAIKGAEAVDTPAVATPARAKASTF